MPHCLPSGGASRRTWPGRAFAAIFVLTLASTADSRTSQAVTAALLLPDGGYVYAPHASTFADASEGLTLEAWLRLDAPLADNTLYPLVFKQGSYAIAVSGRDLRPDGLPLRIPGQGALYFRSWGVSGASFLAAKPFGPQTALDWPMHEWVHFAYQILATPDAIACNAYFDGANIFYKDVEDTELGTAKYPLFVGGLSPDKSAWLLSSLRTQGFALRSFGGWIDEVRISRGLRYGRGRNPARGEGPDADTVALWTFDNPPTLGDVSGNGHTLFPGGSLAVSAEGRLATTWAELKRQ